MGSRVSAVPLWGWGMWGPWRVCRILCGSSGDSVWLEPHLSLGSSPLDGETSVPPRFSVLCTCGAPAVYGHVSASGSALGDPPSFSPGKGGERGAYTPFGRDAGVSSLTQVRLRLQGGRGRASAALGAWRAPVSRLGSSAGG